MESLPYRPRYCVWELTLACNLRCGHCGSDAGCARADEMNTAECLDTVAQLADLECRLITLSGGEPTLRADWEAIAKAGVDRGVTVNMVTNGTTLTADLAKRIAGSGLANVGVSIDGPERVHDEIRGKGTFRRSTRGISQLVAAGVPTAVLTHLERRTASCLDEIHETVVELGAKAWRLQLGKPMGRLGKETLLRPRDLLTVLPEIARIKMRSPIWIDVGDSVGYYGPWEKTLRRTGWGGMQDVWSGCQAGRFAIGIESDGGVKGCLSLQSGLDGCDKADPFREGSLREQRLEAIWFNPDAFAFNRHQKLEDLTGACRSCKHAVRCRGGAKCVAAAFTGALSEDPYCYWRVAQAASRKQKFAREVRQGAAAALFGLGVSAGLSGCFAAVGEAQDDRTDAAMLTEPIQPAGPDAGQILETQSPDAAEPAMPPDAGIDCENVNCTAMCDYGCMPPPSECCHQPAKDAGTPPDAAMPPDASESDPCIHVCCQCDYGIIPEGCCK